MGNSEFRLNIISALNKQLSRKQIKGDLKTFDNSLYVKVIAKLATALSKKQIKQDLKQLNQLNLQIGASLKVSSAQKKDIQKQIKKLQSELGNLQLGIGTKNSGSSTKRTTALKAVHAQTQAIKSELKTVDKMGATLGSTLKNGLTKVLGSFGKFNVISQLNQQLRNAWTEAQTLDSSLVNLQKVTDEIADRNALYKYFDRAMSKAQDLNVKVNSLIYAITEFKKLGWSLPDAELGAKWATILENVGDTNIDTAIGSIKTAIASFDKIGGYGNDQLDKKLEAYVSLINNMSNRYSIDAESLAEAIRLSAGTLTEAHTSIEQAATMFSTANKYYNDASYLGNTVKIGSLRMRASEGDSSAVSELENMGEEIGNLTEATSSLREQLLALTGVDIMVDEHTFKSYYDQLYEISQVIDKLNDTSRANVLETLFGKNRSAAGAAILSGMKESVNAYNDAINSAGSATAEYEVWMESADAASQRFANNVTEAYQSIISGNTVRDLTNLSSAVLEFANAWGIVEGTLRGFLTLGILKGITSLTVAFKNSALQMSNYGTALNTVRDMSAMTKGTVEYKDALKTLKDSCVGLTDAQLKQVLANRNLSKTQLIEILQIKNLNKEEQKARLAQLGLIQTTNAQTAANRGATASVFSLKNAITGLKTTFQTAWATNPIGIAIMAISVAVGAFTSLMSKHNQELEETRQKNIEAANAASENADKLKDLYTEYQRLANIQDRTTSEEEEFKTAIEDITVALGDKAKVLEGLTAGTDEYAEALARATKEELRSQATDATVGRKSAEEALQEDIWSDWKGSKVSIDSNSKGKALSEETKRAVDAVSESLKEFETINRTWNNISWDISSDDPVKAFEFYNALKSAREDLVAASENDETILDTEIYSDLNDAINTMSGSLDTYIEQLYEEEKLNYMVQNGIPTTTEEYKAMEEAMSGAASSSVDLQNKFKELLTSDFTSLATDVQNVADAVSNAEITPPTFDPSTFSEAMKSLSSLQTVYNDFYNDVHKDKVDFTFDIGDIEALREDFGGVCDFFNEFEKLATSSSTTADQLQNAFDRLATEYIFNSGVLDKLTTDNREMIASQLQLQGIMGASSLLTQEFAQACENARIANLNFADATLAQISGFIEEGQYAEETKQKIYLYALQKKLANENCLSTYGDILALEALCKNLGVATDALQLFTKAKNLQARIDNGTSNEFVEKQLANTKEQIKSLASEITVTSSGYTNMSQSAANAANSASKSTEKEVDIMSELNSEMDEYQSKLEAIKNARETYNEHGKISIDQAQEILDADFKLLAAYGDEEVALKDLGKAKLNEMQIQLARNAIDTINNITSEAAATQYLAGANENLVGTSLTATEAMLQQAVAAAKLRGEMQGLAADTILQGYQNGAMMLGQVDFSFDSTEVEKTALEKFQDWFSTLFDWIEKKLERQAEKIDKYVKHAENHLDAGKYTTSADYYRKAINGTVTQIGYQDEASKKYKKQANEVLSRAVSEGVITQDDANSIAYNVKNGTMDISEYSDEMTEVISAYEEWNDKAKEAAEAIEDLHENIREYIKDLKDVRDAQRDAKIDSLDLYTTIGTNGVANTLRTKNDQLYYKTSQLGNQNKAYDTAIKNANTDVTSIGNTGKNAINSALNSSEAKKDKEYRTALNNAKKAIKSKNSVSGADLKVIKKYSITTYNNLFAYNRSLENLETAKLEQATNYAATSAEIQQNRDEKAENRRTELNDNISLLTQKSDNAQSAAEANRLLDQAASKYNAIVNVDDRAIATSTTTVSSNSKTISKKKGTTSKYNTLKSDDKIRKLVNKYISDAKAAVKKGVAIDSKTIAGLAKYYSEGYISETFYEACIDYNNALESLEQAKIQKEIDAETAKAEKAAIGNQKFSNVEQEYTNKQTVVSDKTAMIQAKQNTKTTRGLSLNASDYTDLLNQSKEEQKIYTDEIVELQKTIQENLNSGYWTTSSQEYLDAVSAVNAYEVKVQDCTTAQEEWNNALAQLPYDTIEAALDLLDAVADYNKSLADLKAAASKDLSEDDYLQQIKDNNDQIAKYQEERLQAYQDYQKALANPDGVYGGKTADQWLAEYKQFGTTINNLKSDNEALKDSLRDDVYWRDLERAHQAAERLQNVVQGLSDLISDDMLYDSDGRLTDYGVTQVANLVKQYELAREEVQNYTNDIKNLNDLYADGQYEEEEYKKKLNELQASLLESAASMKSYTDSIMDMYKSMAQAELDALFELIDARNEALQKKKEYYDYDKSIRDKNKNIQSLQAEIAALEGVTGAEAKAKLAKKQAELAEAQEDLDDTITEHQFELSQDALADMKEVLQDAFDEKWDHIAGNLDEITELMNAANDLTAGSTADIVASMNKLLQYYGIDPVSTGVDAAYARGTKKVPRNMLALTNENGGELIVTKDGLLTPLEYGDGVVPAELTERLYDMAMGNYPMMNIPVPEIKIPNIEKRNMGTTIQQHFDSLIHVDGSVDTTTLQEMKKMTKNILQDSYEYTSHKMYDGCIKAGFKRRV